MELKQYATIIRRWWLTILLAGALAGLVALVVSSRMPPTYEASTVLVVIRHDPGFEDLDVSQRLTATYAELLRKRPVLEAVIAHLQLNTDAETLAKQIRVNIGSETLLIVLTVKDPNPQRAADIANEMVRVLSLQGRELLGFDQAAARSSLHVVEAAKPPSEPISPKPLRSVILATALGVLLATGVAMLLEYLNDTVQSSDEVEALTGRSTLATIGRIDGSNPADKLITNIDPFSPIVEDYRLLQASITLATIVGPLRTIAITSSIPLEGKSTTAANLAISLAQMGKRVILVDMDLRRPSLHTLFRTTNTRGVITALLRSTDEPLDKHLVATGVESLYLMPSGPLPPNPPLVLGSPLLARLIEELKACADLVIFDSPPALGIVDSMLLARACDATLLVVLADSTRSSTLKQASSQLAQFGVKPLGVVLNGVRRERGSPYGYYGSYSAAAQPTSSSQRRPLLRLPFSRRRAGPSSSAPERGSGIHQAIGRMGTENGTNAVSYNADGRGLTNGDASRTEARNWQRNGSYAKNQGTHRSSEALRPRTSSRWKRRHRRLRRNRQR